MTNAAGKKLTYLSTKGPLRDAKGDTIGLFGVARDITARKQHEEERELTVRLMRMLNVPSTLHNLVRDVIALLRDWSGCEAVGIRLRAGEDYPYFETIGFPEASFEKETHLCIRNQAGQILRDGEGKPLLDCMCGNILGGRRDATQPFFTAKGSFWSNSITTLLATTSEFDDKLRFCDRCNLGDYESIALIPLLNVNQILGLLQFNDRRPNRFTAAGIVFLETLADSLAISLAHRQSEEALLQAKENWESTFDAHTDMITIHDKDFNVLRANKAARKILGMEKPEGMQLAKCFHYCHATEQPISECPAQISFRTGEPATACIFEPHLSAHVEIRTMARFGPDGRVLGVIHIVRDITESRKVEEQFRQAQKMEGIGQLTGGIAHDFNNILGAIVGYGEMLLMKVAADDPLRQNIERILGATEKAVQLTKSLLLFSSKHNAVTKPVYLDAIVRNIQPFLERVIGEDIEFRVIFHQEEIAILADANLMEQVLVNLATNARDAMSGGGILTITLEVKEIKDTFLVVREEGKPGFYALLMVNDTGKGIDNKSMQKIFDPFFTTKEAGKGTGLGLSVVYGIIKQHNGYIQVYSEPGMGTSFKLYLPLIEPFTARAEKSTEIVLSAGGGETILLAEDNEALRETMVMILQEFGYDVITAVDGDDAVKKFQEHKDGLQLLLFDLIMPKKNGKEAFDEIAKLDPNIAVIFLSGYASDEVRRRLAIENDAFVLSKPVLPSVLLQEVQSILEKKRKMPGMRQA